MSDIEQLLRDRLQAAPPSFPAVSVLAVGDEVRRRRRTTRGAVIVAAAVLSGTAIIAPVAVLGARHAGVRDSATSAGGAALSDAGGRVSGGYGATTPSAASAVSCSPPYTAAHVAIDYVDFVEFGGRQYTAGQRGVPERVPAGAVGRKVGVVRCELSTILPDPSYHPVDGDAAYLTPGTALYAIEGVSPTVRIAARVGSVYRVYQVYPAPARTR